MRVKTKLEKLEKILKPKESTIFILHFENGNLTNDEEQILNAELDLLEKRGGVNMLIWSKEEVVRIKERRQKTNNF